MTIKEIWIKALRSGKYKQGPRYLNVGDYYCCLGVLAVELGILHRTHSGVSYVNTVNGTSQAYLDSTILPYKYQDKLGQMNDYSDRTFDEIANWIEENIEEIKYEKTVD